MHKHYYASGFLYHPGSEKILLQRSSSPTQTYKLFSARCSQKGDPIHFFQKLIQEQLNIDVSLEAITHVYDYVLDEEAEMRSVYYITLESEDITTEDTEWFTSRQISKAKLPHQTLHDITIAQRVIRSKLEQ